MNAYALIFLFGWATGSFTSRPEIRSSFQSIATANGDWDARGALHFLHRTGAASGPAFLFIHDLRVGANASDWSAALGELASLYDVYAPDLVGYGRSVRRAAERGRHATPPDVRP